MNLQPFANRVSFIEAAVWSSSSPLKVERGHYRDGQSWSFQVRPCRTGESPDVQGLTVDELIAGSGGAPVDLLKMDIEAAERDVFAADGSRWIAHVRNIAVELHDDECVRLFRNAIGMSSWSETQSGDLTICRRIQTA